MGCGRDFDWRKKWSANWAEVKYCSKRCKRERLDQKDVEIEALILKYLNDNRGVGVVTASDVAEQLWDAPSRQNCERVLRGARRLAIKSLVTFRNGHVAVSRSAARLNASIKLEDNAHNV